MNNFTRILLVAGILIIAVSIYFYLTIERDSFVNPYEGVDWENIGYYHANFHTHTTFSDGRYDPHQAIDKYHDLNYDILALTDHDTHHHHVHPRTLYPWTALNDIYHKIKDEIKSDTITFSQNANEEWQNRYPDQLNMLSVEGSEISRGHHIGSYWNDFAEGEGEESRIFEEIAERDGISMFFHPGRYDHEPEWYVEFFEEHSHLVGMEIYNQVDRYPVDRIKWDRILYRTMPDRPIWGFANDDTHQTHHFGANRNVFLLNEMNYENVRDAMIAGHIYLFVPEELGVEPNLHITNITSTRNQIEITVDGNDNDYEIKWITHDPESNDSSIFHRNNVITLSDVPEYANFVRAVIVNDTGRTYTQPFGIIRVE